MRLTVKCPFETDRLAQVLVPPDVPLGRLVGDQHAHITGCQVNGSFLDDWPAYVPAQADSVTLFTEPQEFVSGTVLLTALITTLISTAFSIGLSFLMRALMPTQNRTEGKPEQVYGIAGALTYGGERIEVPDEIPPLVHQVLGAPFRLGGDSPHTGFDCQSLVTWLLVNRAGDPERCTITLPTLAPIWMATPDVPRESWRDVLQPWDVVFWKDEAANVALQEHSVPDTDWYHVGLAVSGDILVTSTMDAGVCLMSAARIAKDYPVLAVIR